MAEVDPTQQIQRSTPRQTTIVDAVAETRRVVTASLRSNPLRNALVDDGLMKWNGNYNAGTSVGKTFLWVGEFFPRDAVLNKPQRGFILTRDDPTKARVLWVYDPWAAAADGNTPLRQLVSMHDADDRPVLVEHRDGGLGFPSSPIPLMEFADEYRDVGGTLVPVPAWAAARPQASFDNLYEGTGPMTGVRIRIVGIMKSVAGTNLICRARISFGDGNEYFSPEESISGDGVKFFQWTMEDLGPDRVGSTAQVQIQARVSNGGTGLTVVQPSQCYSFS